MLESAEVGNQVSKEDYKAALPELRLGLVDAQYKLRESDFPVVIWIAGDDSIAAHEMVNRLNEWMDTRYLDTRVFADESQEEERARGGEVLHGAGAPSSGRASAIARKSAPFAREALRHDVPRTPAPSRARRRGATPPVTLESERGTLGVWCSARASIPSSAPGWWVVAP